MQVSENFIEYLWKFQKFNKENLKTTKHDLLYILSTGMPNYSNTIHFHNAIIKIKEITLNGHIYITKNSSDWYNNELNKNKKFNNIILCIVWNNDIKEELKREDTTSLPILELQYIANKEILVMHKKLIKNNFDIPCKNYIKEIDSLDRKMMLEKALFQKLRNKNSILNKLLSQNKGNWEETAYQIIAYNFGFKYNSKSLLQLSKSLPYKLLKKHSTNLNEIEALLFGHSNLLPKKTSDKYIENLKKTYNYLSHKYNIQNSNIPSHQWTFSNIRPANYPTIRIAQLSKLIYNEQNIFDLLTESKPKDLFNILNIKPSIYWKYNYKFKDDKVLKTQNSSYNIKENLELETHIDSSKYKNFKIPGLGRSSIENIMINSVVPILVCYGKHKNQEIYTEKAIKILQDLPPEKNHITKKWENVKILINNAFESQGYLELYNNFCSKKKCLKCNIGNKILNNNIKINPILCS